MGYDCLFKSGVDFSIAATGQCTFMKRVVEYSLKESEAKHPCFMKVEGWGSMDGRLPVSATIMPLTERNRRLIVYTVPLEHLRASQIRSVVWP